MKSAKNQVQSPYPKAKPIYIESEIKVKLVGDLKGDKLIVVVEKDTQYLSERLDSIKHKLAGFGSHGKFPAYHFL